MSCVSLIQPRLSTSSDRKQGDEDVAASEEDRSDLGELQEDQRRRDDRGRRGGRREEPAWPGRPRIAPDAPGVAEPPTTAAAIAGRGSRTGPATTTERADQEADEAEAQ